MGRPRTKGGGVPPPMRAKDKSRLVQQTMTTASASTPLQQHDDGIAPTTANGNSSTMGGIGHEYDDMGISETSKSSRRTKTFVVLVVVLVVVGAAAIILMAAACVVPVAGGGGEGATLLQHFQDWLLPWGYPTLIRPTSTERPTLQYAVINMSSDDLRFRHGRTRRIVERPKKNGSQHSWLLKAPETILFDSKGTMLIMTEESQLVRLDNFQPPSMQSSSTSTAQLTNASTTVSATTTFVRDLGPGRPLGGAFGYGKHADTLYIADTVLGLTRIRNYKDPTSKLEIVASSLIVDDDDRTRTRHRRFKYVDDVVVGPKSNKVYFTDATRVAPDRIFRRHGAGIDKDASSTWTWDTLHGSKVDLMLGQPTGRVYEYDPNTDTTRELGKGFQFANGISMDAQERFLVVSETFGPKIHKYWLQGPKSGQWEVLVDSHQLPGYPDGIDCEPTGHVCYAVMPSAIVPLHKLLTVVPWWLDWILRTLLLMVPRQLAPPTKPYAGIVAIDTDTGHTTLLQDPDGSDVSLLCGVTFHKNKLYLGSVHNHYVAVYDLVKK